MTSGQSWKLSSQFSSGDMGTVLHLLEVCTSDRSGTRTQELGFGLAFLRETDVLNIAYWARWFHVKLGKPKKKILVLDPSLNSLHLKNQGARKMRDIHTIYQLSQLSPNWAQRKTRQKIIWAIKVCIIFLRDIRRSFVIWSLAHRRNKKWILE